jgi:hypothetical protein
MASAGWFLVLHRKSGDVASPFTRDWNGATKVCGAAVLDDGDGVGWKWPEKATSPSHCQRHATNDLRGLDDASPCVSLGLSREVKPMALRGSSFPPVGFGAFDGTPNGTRRHAFLSTPTLGNGQGTPCFKNMRFHIPRLLSDSPLPPLTQKKEV